MKKYNFNKKLTGFDGIEGEQEIGKVLSSLLGNATRVNGITDPMKVFRWAETLYNSSELSLDDSDAETLRKFIEGLEIGIFIKGRILECFKQSAK